MEKEIHKIPESEILERYPIKSAIAGWYFRTIETSNNAWQLEGSDVWGRKVSCQGCDPVRLIIEAEAMAKNIQERTSAS